MVPTANLTPSAPPSLRQLRVAAPANAGVRAGMETFALVVWFWLSGQETGRHGLTESECKLQAGEVRFPKRAACDREPEREVCAYAFLLETGQASGANHPTPAVAAGTEARMSHACKRVEH